MFINALRSNASEQNIISFIGCFSVFMRGNLLIILFLFLFFEQTSFAAQKIAAQKIADGIIITKIKSNFIDIKREDEAVYLYGDVIVERQDLSVLADKMVVYYYENSKEDTKEDKVVITPEKHSEKTQGIKRIEAKDNVKMFNDEFVATGKSGVYDPKEDNFILEEDVVLNKGTSIAKGQKFIYNLTTKKGSLVRKKDDSRVIVIINDSDVKKSKSNKK